MEEKLKPALDKKINKIYERLEKISHQEFREKMMSFSKVFE